MVLLLSLAAGCGNDFGTSSSTTLTGKQFEVAGRAHAGPVCPVVQFPPDPSCDDRPVEGAVLQVLDESGDVAGVATTAADGSFVITLPEGRYRLVPDPVEGLMGTAPPVEFEVKDGPIQNLDIAYDTGIR